MYPVVISSNPGHTLSGKKSPVLTPARRLHLLWSFKVLISRVLRWGDQENGRRKHLLPNVRKRNSPKQRKRPHRRFRPGSSMGHPCRKNRPGSPHCNSSDVRDSHVSVLSEVDSESS